MSAHLAVRPWSTDFAMHWLYVPATPIRSFIGCFLCRQRSSVRLSSCPRSDTVASESSATGTHAVTRIDVPGRSGRPHWPRENPAARASPGDPGGSHSYLTGLCRVCHGRRGRTHGGTRSAFFLVALNFSQTNPWRKYSTFQREKEDESYPRRAVF